MNSFARIQDMADRRGETIQMVLAGFLPKPWPLNWKSRQNGTLIVTNDSVAFFPADRLGRVRSLPYSAIDSVEVRSFLGRRTATFHTGEGALAIRCLASRRSLADLFAFVNDRIGATAEKEHLQARYALTKLRVGSDDLADDLQGDQEYEDALRQLFREEQQLTMNPGSAPKKQLAARYALTKLEVGADDVAEGRHSDEKYENALRQLFREEE